GGAQARVQERAGSLSDRVGPAARYGRPHRRHCCVQEGDVRHRLMRLGVLGTLVWDRIFSRDGRSVPVEEWGGIAYALAAASAACPRGATIVPLIRVGSDLSER